MSSYFSKDFLKNLSPPTKLNPYATSFKPRNFERSQSLSEDSSVQSDNIVHCEFYVPNPVAPSGIVAYVNSRFGSVSRRDAQLLELLAPQRPLDVKELCSYCYKRSPKSARHQFKDKENRIICPLVGYKLAALRTYRKRNPKYKEILDIGRKMTVSKTLTTNDLVMTGHRSRTSSLSSALECNRNKYYKSNVYEQEMHHLEVDYYKKLQNSEREYSTKSNKEILAYMPISERIVARLHQSISSSDDERSEILSYSAPKHALSKQFMSKTVDLSKIRSANMEGTGEQFNEKLEYSKMDSSSSDKSVKSSKSHRRMSLAPNLKTYSISDRFIRPQSTTVEGDSNFKFLKPPIKVGKEKSSRGHSKHTKESLDTQTFKTSLNEDAALVDPDSTLLSSISSSTSIFNSENSGYNCSMSSRDVKTSDEELFLHDNSLDTSSRNKSINLTNSSVSDNGEDTQFKSCDIQSQCSARISNDQRYLCENNSAKNEEKYDFNNNENQGIVNIKSRHNEPENQNFILDSLLVNQLWKVINPAKNEQLYSDVVVKVALELWTAHKLLKYNPVDASKQKLLQNAVFQKINQRKMSLGAFLKQNLKRFDANISITNSVVKILKFSGLFGQLSRSTLHSETFWKDLFYIWNRCCNLSTETNEKIYSEFASLFMVCNDSTYLASFLLINMEANKDISHSCNNGNGYSESIDSLKVNCSTDNIDDSMCGLYLQKILCFSCISSSIIGKRPIPGLKIQDLLFPIFSRLKGILRERLENSLEELELLDFFFDNRYFIVNQFLKNSNEKIRRGLLFDEEKIGQVRLVIKTENIAKTVSQKLSVPEVNSANVPYSLWC